MDAAHLTSVKTRGIMQATVKLGADKEVHLQTLSVCAGNETRDSWKFHLETERKCLGLRGEHETYISDRKPGLEGIIHQIYPTVKLGACVKHLEDNLSKGENRLSKEGIKI